MQKLELPANPGRLLLDHCGRCGGFWFDAGEVDQLRRLGARAIETHVSLTAEAYRKRCGTCDASYLRNADRCPACKAPNLLRCPGCTELLTPVRTGNTKLDGCRSCRGVWFDGVELKDIWNAALIRRHGNPPGRGVEIAANSVDAFLLASFLMPDPSIAAGGVADLAGGAAAIGAHAGSGVLDAAGDVASSVFDAIADLISGIFG